MERTLDLEPIRARLAAWHDGEDWREDVEALIAEVERLDEALDAVVVSKNHPTAVKVARRARRP